MVNKTKAYNPTGPNGPSYSAYISYLSEADASIAILAIDNIEVDDHILRASFGTTKYCTFFLKNMDCPNKDCLYLHHLANDDDIINRDDMNSNTNVFYEQQLLAMKIADIFNADVKKKLKNINLKKKCIFPTTDSIYNKDIVIEQNNEYNDVKFYENNNLHFKNKKKFNDDYYKNYYDDNTKYSDYQDNDYFYEDTEDDKYLQRDKSENFTSNSKYSSSNKKSKIMSIDSKNEDGNVTKFISKSKSPITNKKMAITKDKELLLSSGKPIMNSLSPNNKKLDIEEKLSAQGTGASVNSFASPPIKKLYRKRDESRFSFAKTSNNKSDHNTVSNKNNINVIKENNQIDINSDDNIVPDYVSDVICKKISRHTFFKKFEKYFEKENCDYDFFQKDLKQNDTWSSFILSNMNSDKVGSFEKIK